MKLNDLIKSHHWLSVELILLKLYPDQLDMIDDYKAIFEKLQILAPEEDDMLIVLREYDSYTTDGGELETYVDVSGRKKQKELNSMTDSYALEFVEWSKWLGMDLATETTSDFTELEIVAHCLYEMTFIDFDEDGIKGELDSLNDTIDEYKSMTDEERKLNTTTLDELLKGLEEDKNDQSSEDDVV